MRRITSEKNRVIKTCAWVQAHTAPVASSCLVAFLGPLLRVVANYLAEIIEAPGSEENFESVVRDLTPSRGAPVIFLRECSSVATILAK